MGGRVGRWVIGGEDVSLLIGGGGGGGGVWARCARHDG